MSAEVDRYDGPVEANGHVGVKWLQVRQNDARGAEAAWRRGATLSPSERKRTGFHGQEVRYDDDERVFLIRKGKKITTVIPHEDARGRAKDVAREVEEG